MDITQGVSAALYVENFTWDRSDFHSNFNILNFSRSLPLTENGLEWTLFLDLKVSHGKGWSQEDTTKATK